MTPQIKQRLDQIRQGQVPSGYKRTRARIVPNEWQLYTISDCLEKVDNPVQVEPNTLYTQIGIRSHGKGLFYKEPILGKELGNKSVFWIEPNCFVLNIVFAWEQAIGRTTDDEVGMIASHRFPMYRPINNCVDLDFLTYYFLTKRGTDVLDAASPGGAGRNRTLGQDRFVNSKIMLPPLPEQQKIAEILSAQDKLIALKEKLIEEKKRQKKYLMQQLLTGKRGCRGLAGSG
jgi:type I restriction enzyme S subunit